MKPALICALDRVTVSTTPLCVMLSLSPATALLGRSMRTSTLPLSSVALMNPLLLASSPMVTFGAPGSVRLMAALSVTRPLVLPARSRSWALATKVVPSPGLLKLTLTLPAAMCSALRVMLTGSLPVPLTSSWSPATALGESCTRTFSVLLCSAVLRVPLLSASVVMLTLVPLARLDRSTRASSLPVALALPAASCSWALTLRLVPLTGAAKLASTRPAAIWSAVRVRVCVWPSLVESTSWSPALTLVLSKVLTTTIWLASAASSSRLM